jgi:hypothetical protein
VVIDWATHRKWVLASAGGVVIAAVAYVPHAMSVRTKPFGGTAIGITYGAAGLALIIFADSSAPAKRFPHGAWGACRPGCGRTCGWGC